MIKTERYSDTLIRTYSDAGKYNIRDGEKYEDAIDPISENRTYTESDEYINLEMQNLQENLQAREALNFVKELEELL